MLHRESDRFKKEREIKQASQRKLAEQRWVLTLQKYRDGLDETQHEQLLWLSDYCWRNRHEVYK